MWTGFQMLVSLSRIKNGHPVFSEISSRLMLLKMNPNYEIQVVSVFMAIHIQAKSDYLSGPSNVCLFIVSSKSFVKICDENIFIVLFNWSKRRLQIFGYPFCKQQIFVQIFVHPSINLFNYKVTMKLLPRIASMATAMSKAKRPLVNFNEIRHNKWEQQFTKSRLKRKVGGESPSNMIFSEIVFFLKNWFFVCPPKLLCRGCSVYWESVSQMQLYSSRRIFCSLTSKLSCYIQFYCKSDAVNILFDLICRARFDSSKWGFLHILTSQKVRGFPQNWQ